MVVRGLNNMEKRLTYNIDAYKKHHENRFDNVYLGKDEINKILKTLSELKDMLDNEEMKCEKKFPDVIVNRMTVLNRFNTIGSLLVNQR